MLVFKENKANALWSNACVNEWAPIGINKRGSKQKLQYKVLTNTNNSILSNTVKPLTGGVK